MTPHSWNGEKVPPAELVAAAKAFTHQIIMLLEVRGGSVTVSTAWNCSGTLTACIAS